MEQEKELGGSGDSFKEAAAQVFESERPPENPKPVSFSQSEGEDDRAPSIPLAELIDDGVAAWVSKATFWPLARYAHPAWALTDEQAEMLGPELKPYLQEWVKEILPPSFHDYLAKNKKMGKLIFAFSAMLLIKRSEVKHAKRLEHADELIAKAKEDEKKSGTAPIDISKPAPSASPKFEFHLPPKPEESPAS